MSASEIKELRRHVRREVEPTFGAIIATLDKQAGAVAQLSEDVREAFQQQNDKIRDLIALTDALALRVAQVESR